MEAVEKCDRSVAVTGDGADPQFIGVSPALRAVREAAAAVADRHSSVVMLGETGTGKEMLARYIHRHSRRCEMPFIPVDCSALTDTLFESQLFGHVRGAFTGAIRDSLGFIRAAHGGTLFLDEIGELSLTLQVKLLRVLQERCVVPVGETRPRAVDVRVITATNRDLEDMVRAGRFRQDLFFRLNVIVMTLPPLRERTDDILLLARHFLRAQAEAYGEPSRRLSPEAVHCLLDYAWPGNVRELAHVMEYVHVVSRGEVAESADLPTRVRSPRSSQELFSELRLEDVERRTIAEALRRTNQCKAAAARMLGIQVQRLNRRILRLGLQVPLD